MEEQQSVLEDMCVAEGWDVFDIYSDDGLPGSSVDRPGYNRMMSDIDSWDVLLVLNVNRIHTSVRNNSTMMRQLERKMKLFVSCAGPEDCVRENIRKRVAIYSRVSTDEQAMEGYSLEAQKATLLDYCIAEDWEPYRNYEDDGYSGRNTNRPGYRRMLDEIDQWDILLVVKMDRIHRNSRNFMSMMEMLEKNGKKFVSYSDALDTSNALGRFVIDMIQRIAQLESEQIGERTYMGMREKAETLEGSDSPKRTMGFNPPFGYRLNSGALEADWDELDVVTSIFSMYASGRTIDEICYDLNRSGQLTRRGNPWNKYNLRNILHNPIYAGYMRWEELLLRHDADTVLTPEQFNRIQELMASKVRDPSKRNVFLLPNIDK